MSEDDDPFDEFEASTDREGNPFDDLELPTEQADDETDGDEPATDTASPFESLEPPETDDEIAGDTNHEAATQRESEPFAFDDPDDAFETEDDPFNGMDGRDGDPFGAGESVFESVDVETVDADDVWATLDADEPETAEGNDYAEVSKHRYCKQCEHFAEPPSAHCTHEDAEILEYLDMETVRLLNCPVVAEKRELGHDE